jgi:rare lipoprotein A
MLFRFLLSASIVAGALAPAAVEARSSCGEASFYGHGDGFAWRTMANGRPMNPQAMTTAHPSLPLGTRLHVRNPSNGKSVKLVVTDRGPYHGGRVLDLSHGAFQKIARASQGVVRVCYSMV